MGNSTRVLSSYKTWKIDFSGHERDYNTLIAGHCEKGLLNSAWKLKNMMGKNGLQPVSN